MIPGHEAPLAATATAASESPSPQVTRIRQVYRRFARVYDAFRAIWSRWTRPIEQDLDRLFRERIGPDTRILELAPGTGINIDRLLRCSADFGSYLGIDASEEMLARARPRTRSDERIELRLGDATDLKDVGDGTVDFVVSTWLLSHLDAPAATVRDALTKLAPGGTAAFVFFTTPRWAVLRVVLRTIRRPFSYDLVDPDPIVGLPDLEHLSTCAGGMATLAVFRAPTDATPRP